MTCRAIIFAFTISAVHAAKPQYTIPARERSGFRLEVQVRVNGAGPFWCTLDSGAGGFALDSTLGARAGLRPSGAGRSFGEGPGAVPDQRVSHAMLQVEDLRIQNQTVMLRPLEDGCIFGTMLIDRFVVEIDYLAPEIRLYAANTYRPPQQAIRVPLLLDPYRRPMVLGRLLLEAGDAVTARLLLDSAVPDYTLSLTRAFTDRQNIRARVRQVVRPPFHAQSTGGTVDLLATRISRLSVGSAAVRDPVVMLFRSDSAAPGRHADGSIGSGFLHRFLVTIDAPGGRLYLTPNRRYGDPEPTWPWSANLAPVR